jgi:hypothetical protein
VSPIDDTLSVECAVAKHLFDEWLRMNFKSSDGNLDGASFCFKCATVLAIPILDRIVVVGDGHVVEQGTYALPRRQI